MISLQREVMKVKQDNKNKLTSLLTEATGVDINPCSMFDIQVCITLLNLLRPHPTPYTPTPTS